MSLGLFHEILVSVAFATVALGFLRAYIPWGDRKALVRGRFWMALGWFLYTIADVMDRNRLGTGLDAGLFTLYAWLWWKDRDDDDWWKKTRKRAKSLVAKIPRPTLIKLRPIPVAT